MTYIINSTELMDMSTDMFMIMKSEEIKWVNFSTINSLGAIEKNEIVGRSLAEFLHSEYAHFVKEIIESDNNYKSPLSLIMKKINGLPCEVNASLHILSRDDDSHIIFIGRDVTAENKTARINLDNTKYITDVLSNVSDGIIVSDQGGNIISFNRAAEKIFGYRATEVIGRNTTLLMSDTDARAHQGYVDQFTRNVRIKTTSQDEAREIRGKTKSGLIIPLEIALSMINVTDGKRVIITIHDISEHVRAKTEIIESHKRYEDIVSASSDWFWETNEYMEFTNIVGNISEECRLSSKIIIGKNRSEYEIDPLSPSWFRGGVLPDHNGKKMPFRDVVIGTESKELSPLWFRLSGTPFYDISGEFKGYRGSGSDVTKEIETNQKLYKVESQLRTALKTIGDGILICDQEDRIVLYNEQYINLKGCSASVAKVGMKYEDFLREAARRAGGPGAHVGHLSTKEWVEERLRRHREPGPPFEQQQLDGRWVLITEYRTVDGGYVGVRSDITARKNAEASLKRSQALLAAVMGNSPLGIALKDEAARYVVMSSDYESIKGVKAADAVGKTAVEIFAGSAGRKVYSEDITVLSERKTIEKEVEYNNKDIARVEKYVKFPIIAASGEVIGVGEISTDITERRAFEEQRSSSQRLEAIGQLAGGIAHDFNNILMVIGGYAKMAQHDLGDPNNVSAALKEIISAYDKATGLIKQLMIFSRRQVLENTVFTVSEILDETATMLKPLLGETVRLSVNACRPEICVYADRGSFSQAVTNLVINARDAMARGGEISVVADVFEADEQFASLHAGIEQKKYVRISITDEGVGIDDETKKHIFEPFFTTKEPGKGTGLGLPLVHGFAKKSGGTVTLNSTVGKGSTFSLILPLCEGEADAATEAKPDDSVLGNGETILLAEDDAAILHLLRRTLEKHGYKVLTAADGFEALEVEADHDGVIDLLVSDVVMPQLGGFELAEAIRNSRPDVKVVLISGYPSRGESDRRAMGSKELLLAKPIDPFALLRVVHQILNDRNAPNFDAVHE